MNTGLNRDRNFLESIHDLLAPVAGFAIVQRHVCHSTNRLFEHDLAIDHDDNRALVLQTPHIEANGLIGKQDAEAVFAIDREIELDPEAAVIANPERHGFPSPILREFVSLVFEAGISNSVFRDRPGRGDVLIDKRRRNGQRGGDIVEITDFDVHGKNVRPAHIDVNADERFYRSRILRAIHPLNRHVSRPSVRWCCCPGESRGSRQENRHPSVPAALRPEEASGGPATCEPPFPRSRDPSAPRRDSATSRTRPPIFAVGL